ncbi:uncharacterized protein LOC115966434 [Quercus lobata]|uniref:uncharacterized protein LOC115966434 n=1 Tax=Quercus lobata TaxID=97700 RepID=UPI001246BB7E|nr:uncharacterized protein LOC115966434 [Quercus lobata]
MCESRIGRNMEAYIDDMVIKSSLVLVRNKDRIQRLIYYVSKSLQEAETRYLPLEKAVLAIVHSTRNLPYYFQAHTIVVLTQLPLQALLRISDYTGRIAKWGTRLGAYDVKYMPRATIKGQILANFVAKFTKSTPMKEEAVMGALLMPAVVIPPWEVYTDRASNRKGAGIRVVLITPEKLIMEKSLRLGFLATNNKAEYEALLAGVAMVKQLGGEVVELYSNSRLVMGQVNEDFKAQDEMMQGYLAKVQSARPQFKGFVLKQIPRGQNSHANSLAMLATSLGSSLPWVFVVEDMDSSCLTRVSLIGVYSLHVGPSWMDPIVTFLKQGLLLEDKCKAKKVHRSASHYWLSKKQKLYKRIYSGSYLLYMHLEAVEPLLEELHEGICGSHTGGRSLAHRALTQVYW